MNGSETPLVRAIRGPITLMTVGTLFALNNFTQYSFTQTWPVILIVFGLLSLAGRAAPAPPPTPAATASPFRDTTAPPPAPPQRDAAPEPPPPVYNAPPTAAGRGGFGTSAPPRPEPAPQPPTPEPVPQPPSQDGGGL
jgi:hypothetical protein